MNAFNKDHHAFAGIRLAQIQEAEAMLVMRSFSDNLLLRYLMTSGKPVLYPELPELWSVMRRIGLEAPKVSGPTWGSATATE